MLVYCVLYICTHQQARDRVYFAQTLLQRNKNCGVDNNSNNILYSSQREIKAVVRSHNDEHVSVILSRETHAHTHS